MLNGYDENSTPNQHIATITNYPKKPKPLSVRNGEHAYIVEEDEMTESDAPSDEDDNLAVLIQMLSINSDYFAEHEIFNDISEIDDYEIERLILGPFAKRKEDANELTNDRPLKKCHFTQGLKIEPKVDNDLQPQNNSRKKLRMTISNDPVVEQAIPHVHNNSLHHDKSLKKIPLTITNEPMKELKRARNSNDNYLQHDRPLKQLQFSVSHGPHNELKRQNAEELIKENAIYKKVRI